MEQKAPQTEHLIYGKNPVTELLKSGAGVDTVLLSDGLAPQVAAYYTAMAKEAGAVVKRVKPAKLKAMCETDSHQGVAAWASQIEYATLEQLLDSAAQKGEPPFLVLADGVEDPHNLGAILRSALLCGHGRRFPAQKQPDRPHCAGDGLGGQGRQPAGQAPVRRRGAVGYGCPGHRSGQLQCLGGGGYHSV